MGVMELTEAQVQTLLEYPGALQIKQLGLGMALTRLQGVYRANPGPETAHKCARDLNALFEKYTALMRPDFERIVALTAEEGSKC